MTRVKLIATACFTAALSVLALNAGAQPASERTFLTFSAPVELPGVTLPAGTYLFKLADSTSNRHIVQVFGQDETQIHATILAVPAERLDVTSENVVTFREASAGSTPAVHYWYYPGDRIGHEFVYPKDQAMKIAKRTGVTVLSTDGEIASSASSVSSTMPDGTTSEWKREGAATVAENRAGTVQGTATVTAPEPAPEPAPVAQAQPTPAPAPEPEAPRAVGTSGAADELPRTASPLALSGLIGLLSLGGALALRRRRR